MNLKVISQETIPQLDGIAEHTDQIEVEIMPETGVPGKFKLYVHVNGISILRLCKLRTNQIVVTSRR